MLVQSQKIVIFINRIITLPERCFQINPLDYIYGALGCSLSPLKPFENTNRNLEVVDKDSSLANLIMQYVYNTANKDVVIDAIYRTKIEGEKVVKNYYILVYILLKDHVNGLYNLKYNNITIIIYHFP